MQKPGARGTTHKWSSAAAEGKVEVVFGRSAGPLSAHDSKNAVAARRLRALRAQRWRQTGQEGQFAKTKIRA
jgi:hypothetical protein